MDEKLIVQVPSDLADLIPFFLETRQQDVSGLIKGLQVNDFESLRTIGHGMHGTGGSFGFHQISVIGAIIEDAAAVGDAQTVKDQLVALQSYLSRAEITYV